MFHHKVIIVNCSILVVTFKSVEKIMHNAEATIIQANIPEHMHMILCIKVKSWKKETILCFIIKGLLVL